jgi:hypothetical protein
MKMKKQKGLLRACLVSAIAVTASHYVQAADLTTVLPLSPTVSTTQVTGEFNPYGVAFVPKTVPTSGVLQPGDLLVSNFNDINNLQGRGTTIVRVTPKGQASVFFRDNGQQPGLTAALGVLSNGTVVVGNVGSFDGTPATIRPGVLRFLSPSGSLLATLSNTSVLRGPWGLTVYDTGNGITGTAMIFVSDALNGSVLRIVVQYASGSVSIVSTTVITTGLPGRLDPAAFLAGPGGLAYNHATDTLYVADEDNSNIYSITNASTLTSAVSPTLAVDDPEHLHGPIGLVMLPNGHFLVTNSDASNFDTNQPSEMVEYTSDFQFVGESPVDPNNGAAFGVGTANLSWGSFKIAAVDDNSNTVTTWTAVAQ